MKNIDIKQAEINGKKLNWYIYLTVIIIPFLATFFYFWVIEGVSPFGSFMPLLKRKHNIVQFDTYEIFLDEKIVERDQIIKSLEKVIFDQTPRFKTVDKREKADVYIEYGTSDYIISTNYLLPVGHIYWIGDTVDNKSFSTLNLPVVVEQNLYDKYKEFLDIYYPNSDIQVVDNIVESLEGSEGQSMGLVEPSNLSKDLKLLYIDDCYHLDTFNCGIEISLSVNGEIDNLDFVSEIIKKNTMDIFNIELSSENIAKINMTGVTAITRRLAQIIDSKQDYDYPALNIGEFLSDADLTHVSSETSFVEGCTSYSGMRFCSRPQYLETLQASGVDLVELTGNHNNDYGSKYNTDTINTYIENGLGYFGGGLDEEDARKPYITEIDGSKIGFLGYNYYDTVLGTGAIATDSHAGANSYSDSKLKEDIEALEDQVDVIIVDFQFTECYSYPSGDVIFPICYKPVYKQDEVFRSAIDYGADVVVGTQAHQPQTYELYGEGIIFYGLGNLYFDQTPWIGTRQGMVLTHYVYNGELIQTKVTPTIYDSTLQTEIASEDEAQLLLELLSDARESL